MTTLQKVRAAVAGMTCAEQETLAVAAGLSKRALWRVSDPNWEPKAATLAKLDRALFGSHDSTIRTSVRNGNADCGQGAPECGEAA